MFSVILVKTVVRESVSDGKIKFRRRFVGVAPYNGAAHAVRQVDTHEFERLARLLQIGLWEIADRWSFTCQGLPGQPFDGCDMVLWPVSLPLTVATVPCHPARAPSSAISRLDRLNISGVVAHHDHPHVVMRRAFDEIDAGGGEGQLQGLVDVALERLDAFRDHVLHVSVFCPCPLLRR